MESHIFNFVHQFPIHIQHNSSRSFSTLITFYRPFFSGGSRRNWQRNVSPDKRSRFRDVFATDENDDFDLRKPRRRRWFYESDQEEEDDDDDSEGFGFIEGSIALNWVSKAFQSFGWMIPAVIISLVMGNGPDTIIMTLALPLVQSLFSLAADMVWGRPAEAPRSKRRSKKRPFARANYPRARKEKRKATRTGNDSGGYKSWVVVDNVSDKNEKSSQKFGGWDELDNIRVKVDKESSETFGKDKQQN